MNKDLDKKLKLYIAQMAVHELPFGGMWDSSAKKLEKELLARGVRLPYKLYYEYKMPGGVSQSEFMNQLCLLEFFTKFYPKYAVKVLADKKLTASDKAKIFKYVLNTRRKFIQDAKQYESEIRKLNPELANIKSNHPNFIIHGATFGFAPDEIAYYADSKKRNYENERRLEDTFRRIYGINVHYVLAPKTAQNILAALKLHEQKIEKEK